MNRELLVCRDETFGPVIAIAMFGSESEVITAANATCYGLAAYVFSQNAHPAQIVAQVHATVTTIWQD